MSNKIILPRADWDWIRLLLSEHPGHVSDPILNEIDQQLDEQEY
jgi:hypothetical protein